MSYTPLHLATQWNRMNEPSVIAELLRYGAQVNVKDQVSNRSLFLPEVYFLLVHLKWQNLTIYCSSKVNTLESPSTSYQWSYLCKLW